MKPCDWIGVSTWVQGVSTRKVAKITEELCGFEISSTQVSQATAMLDEQLIAWQRCQFHLQQNAQSYVPHHSMKKTPAADIRAIFNAPDESEAKRLLEHFIQRYETTAPELASRAGTAR